MRDTWESLIQDFLRHLKGIDRAVTSPTIYRRAALASCNSSSRRASCPGGGAYDWKASDPGSGARYCSPETTPRPRLALAGDVGRTDVRAGLSP
jgi:hypothetical protein